MSDLIPSGTKVQVSATAPGTSRRAVLLDDDSPWTAPTSPATIALIFASPVAGATHLALTFQGGFVPTSVGVFIQILGAEMYLGKVYPEDKSRRQVFAMPYPPEIVVPEVAQLRLEFESSSDIHGRVTVYRVELLGQ